MTPNGEAERANEEMVRDKVGGGSKNTSDKEKPPKRRPVMKAKKDLSKTHYQAIILYLQDGRRVDATIPAQIKEGDIIVRAEFTKPAKLPKGMYFEKM